jgi:dTDP-4-dehydrorhamnose reductase
MKIKILLLGSAGMAGQVLKKELEKYSDQIDLIDIARSSKISIPKIELDVTNFEELRKIIKNNGFDFIINCIGVLNNFAENNPDKAILINSYLPHYLEKITSETDTKIIHISTDCVFSGKRGLYNESDIKDGIGFYAQSKALGEIINNKDLTLRTSIIGPDLNENGIGLFKWLLKQSGSINGYTNAFWSGITTIQLARVIVDIVLGTNFPSGIIHLTNNHKISKFHLLSIIKEVFELNNIEIIGCDKYRVDKSIINTREDLKLIIPEYREMINDMITWMKINNYKIK